MPSRLARPASSLLLSLVLAACAPSAVTTTSPTESNTPAPGTSPSPSPEPGSAAELAAAELSLRQEIRRQAGLVNMGPGALELAALMDQSESVALKALKPDASGATAQAPAVVLVDAPTPGQSIVGPALILTTDFGTEMAGGVTNTRTLDDNPFPGGCVAGMGTCSGDPGPPVLSGSKTETTHGCSTGTCQGPAIETVTVGGYPGQVYTETTLTTGYAGSSVSMDIKITTYANVTDPVSHATVYRIESTGTGHISGNACPDAAGYTTLHLEFSARENYFNATNSAGGRAGYGLEQSYSADVRVKADDNANLAGIDIAVTAHAESKGGGRGAGDSQSELRTFSNDAAGSQTFGYDPTAGFTAGTDTVAPTSTDGALLLLGGMQVYLTLPAKAAAKATETAWRSGMCIRVHADPNGGKVARDSVTSIKVTVKQRYEGTELDKPVEATFTGVKSLEPLGQKQPAPATFRYTAGSTLGDKGDMTFKSVSNRGIGHTAVQFVVYEACHPDCRLDFTTPGAQSVHWYTLKCGGPQGEWVIEADGVWPGTEPGEGPIVLKSTITFTIPPGGLTGPLTGSETTRWLSVQIDALGHIYRSSGGSDVTYSGIGTFVPLGAFTMDYTQKGTYFDDKSGKHTYPPKADVHAAWPLETGSFC